MGPSLPGRVRSARRLPPPSNLPQGEITQIQRARILLATIDAVEEVGYPNLTVAHVITRARVSRKTFYDLFGDREQCFLEAYEEVLEQARALAIEAYCAEPTWRDGMRSALERLLALMEEQPGYARVCLVDSLAGGQRVLALRARSLEELASIVDRGRRESARPDGPAALTAEAVVGAILAVLCNHVIENSRGPVSHLRGELMSMIVLPFLGPRVARNEVDARCPPGSALRRRRTPRPEDPFEGLEMRLTYRTIRVLSSIQRRPGASNREVGKDSDIPDAGQMSKLLTRLSKLGLIENRGPGQAKGGSNEWWLTARGSGVERATRPADRAFGWWDG